jgi:Zn-dependent protease
MEFLQVIPVLIFSVVVHEVAHAWVALREGDDTAERLGRITLNPLPHLDVIGSLILPALLVASGTGIIFGWAKPVPINPRNFRDPVWGDIRVSMAGIVSNLILTVLFALLAIGAFRLEAALHAPWIGWVTGMATWGIIINLLLALFNLLPIPPLDGSHVVAHLLPSGLRDGYRALGRYGLLILVGLFYLGGDVMQTIFFGPLSQIIGAVLSMVNQLS